MSRWAGSERFHHCVLCAPYLAASPSDAASSAHLQNQCCGSDGFSEGRLENVSGTDHLPPRMELTPQRSAGPVPSPLPGSACADCPGLRQSPFGSRAVQTVGIGEQMALLAAAPGSLAVLGAASAWQAM